jgi:hypothetical protein
MYALLYHLRANNQQLVLLFHLHAVLKKDSSVPAHCQDERIRYDNAFSHNQKII